MFVEIVENQILNMWKIVYCPKHWFIIRITQLKVLFAYLFLKLLKF